MAFWKFQQPQVRVVERWLSDDSPSIGGSTVTPGASGSWGSYTLVDGAAAERDAYWAWLGANQTAAASTDRRMLMDVAIYDGSTYHSQLVATIGNMSGLPANFFISTAGGSPFVIPLFVKAGNRVAVRMMYHTTSPPNNTVYLMTLGAQDFYGHTGGHVIDSLGVDEANVKGTVVSIGTSSSWGSWTSIDSSTDNPYIGGHLFVGQNGASTYSSSNYVRIQTGDGTNVFSNHKVYVNTNETVAPIDVGPFWYPNAVPAGTNLQVRAVTSGSGTFEDIDITLGMIRR